MNYIIGDEEIFPHYINKNSNIKIINADVFVERLRDMRENKNSNDEILLPRKINIILLSNIIFFTDYRNRFNSNIIDHSRRFHYNLETLMKLQQKNKNINIYPPLNFYLNVNSKNYISKIVDSTYNNLLVPNTKYLYSSDIIDNISKNSHLSLIQVIEPYKKFIDFIASHYSEYEKIIVKFGYTGSNKGIIITSMNEINNVKILLEKNATLNELYKYNITVAVYKIFHLYNLHKRFIIIIQPFLVNEFNEYRIFYINGNFSDKIVTNSHRRFIITDIDNKYKIILYKFASIVLNVINELFTSLKNIPLLRIDIIAHKGNLYLNEIEVSIGRGSYLKSILTNTSEIPLEKEIVMGVQKFISNIKNNSNRNNSNRNNSNRNNSNANNSNGNNSNRNNSNANNSNRIENN